MPNDRVQLRPPRRYLAASGDLCSNPQNLLLEKAFDIRACVIDVLCVLGGKTVLKGFFTIEDTARRSRNQTCTYHTPASIVTEGNISARIATNLCISNTAPTESTEKMRSERGA